MRLFDKQDSQELQDLGRALNGGRYQSEIDRTLSAIKDGYMGALEGNQELRNSLQSLYAENGNLSEMSSNLENLSRDLRDLQDQMEGTTGAARDAIKAQYEDKLKDFKKLEKAAYDAQRAEKELNKGFVTKLTENGELKAIGNGFKEMYSVLTKLNDPWAKVSDAASKYAKSIGTSVKGMEALSSLTLKNMTKRHIGINYNVSSEELIKMQNDYVKGIGRNVRIDNNAQENLAAMHAVMQGGEGELSAAFENFGVSLNGTAEHAGRMFQEASEYGISFEKYSSNVAKNIKLAQNYTFKNGIKGLESMAKKAVAMRMDMQQVAALADKMAEGGVDAAIETSAQLQVLGGPFASIADPIGMLSEGLNDMEGLGDRVQKMIGNLGTFNKETGEVEVSSFDKVRIRQAAKATGMSYDSLMESANRNAVRGEISKQLEAAGGMGLNDKMQELVKNVATFENGKAGVSIDGEFKELSELSNNDYEALIAETRSESDDVKQIAKDLHSLVDSREGFRKQKEAVQAQITSKTTGKFEDAVTQGLGHANGLLKALVIIQAGLAAVNAGSQILGGFNKLFRLFGKGGGSTGRVANAIGRGKGLFSKTIKTSSGKEFVKRGGRVFNSQGKELFGAAKNSVLKSGKATGSVANKIKGVGESIKGYGGKAVNSTKNLWSNVTNAGKSVKNATTTLKGAKTATSAAKTASNASKALKVGKLAKGSGVLTGVIEGVTTGIEEFGGNNNHSTARKVGTTTGAAAGGGLGAWGGAALGASIGSIIPGLGTAIGGAIGAVVGGLAGSKLGKWVGSGFANDKRRAKIKEKFGLTDALQGDYSVKEIKEINKARATGKISKKLENKLANSGDVEMLKEIEDRKTGKEDVKSISRASFTVQHATFIGKGFGRGIGGGLGLGMPLIGKGMPRLFNPLSAPVEIIKGVKEVSAFEKVREKARERVGIHRDNEYGKNGAIKLDISGTIKLEGANGKQVDITKELLNNTNFINQISDLITRRMGEKKYGNNTPDRESFTK